MITSTLIAQSPVTKTTNISQQILASQTQLPAFSVMTSAGLALALVALTMYGKLQIDKLEKKVNFEKIRSRELEKKFKLALETIRKMETNPDLVNSRDFNLDYLRMRMSEEVFHFAILNQIKIQIKDKISQALRPHQANQGIIGIASSTGRQIDEIFDVEYETGAGANVAKRVLFRIQIRLIKLPTQATSATISQIIDCLETYLQPVEGEDTWQPTIQGRIAHMHWDQKAKPTPLLVLEQSNEGVNVTFRTNRQPNIAVQQKNYGSKRSGSTR
ncbi:MAG: hypothetical protein EA343_16400 [Nodularia sp. (in: Bacteria)]|nr:MAG: hypothetical protein EA343_16400 [Nodularia sp. (in: cyanobacteria)]